MGGRPTILADADRARLFLLVGTARRPFAGYRTWSDADGLPWAGRRLGGLGLAVTSLGPGWVFDPYSRGRRPEAYAARLAAVAAAGEAGRDAGLAAVVAALRLGGHAERLLWAVHRAALAARASVVRIPDFALARAMWGAREEARPAHWRGDVVQVLGSLARLHAADWAEGETPSLGTATALLTHAADLRGSTGDGGDEGCAGLGGAPHSHFLVNIGRGFLGVLERFASGDDGSGVRRYAFPSRARGRGPTLRRVGWTGRLVSTYLPARLGEPDDCGRLTADQHRQLQAAVRETTRARAGEAREAGAAESFPGDLVPDRSGRSRVACPLLDPDARRCGFNGNGHRRGMDYLLDSPGGWLAKAGYAPGETARFLDDLGALAARLGLVVVGVGAGEPAWITLGQMRAMAGAPALRRELSRASVRLYAPSDSLRRWNAEFGWAEVETAPPRQPTADVLALCDAMREKGVSRAELARGIGADRSFLGKLFAGKKRWPEGLYGRAWGWVASGRPDPPAAPPAPPPRPPAPPPEGGDASALGVALAYRARGWSVVPQRPGGKRPRVRWKPYQGVRPSEDELRSWFAAWPGDGVGVVLGPVSGLLVIDVDGPEAHDELVRRLGGEPGAPKVLSGSGKPCRYHLYFRCPDVPTVAKATPWHPKLEFRGRGGLVVAPPSLHPSGGRYRWAPGRSPDDLALADVPAEVLAALAPRPAPRPAVTRDVALAVTSGDATARFLAGEFADGPRWNDRLFSAACDLAGRDVLQEEAEPLLLRGVRPWGEAEREAALRTIASAYDRPRTPSRA